MNMPVLCSCVSVFVLYVMSVAMFKYFNPVSHDCGNI